MKLISFSLWGSEPRYLTGALENARLARELYPGWVCRFYCGPEVPIGPLLAEGAEVRREETLGPYHGAFWRFFPASEPGVERFIVRDADSRLSPREAEAVRAWEHSGEPFHVLRDHPAHICRDAPILAGMWGSVGGLVPDMRALVRAWGRFDSRFSDQDFLRVHIWPRVRRACLQHEGVPSFWGGRPLPPLQGDYIGFQVTDVGAYPRLAGEEPALVTLIAIPKPFEGHVGLIQENALGTWSRLTPRPEIVLVGDEPGTAEAARRFGAAHVPEVARNELGRPLYSDLLEKGQRAARTELVCHVNADVCLLDDFCRAARVVRSRFSRFLMLGRRTDIDLARALDFQGPWREELGSAVAQGLAGGPTGVEFFLFPRCLLDQAPAFAIGRWFHDSWPIATCRERRIPVVDATEAVTVAHQTHPCLDLPYLEMLEQPEYARNHRLLGGEGRRFSIRHADYRLGPGGLKRAWSVPYRLQLWLNAWKLLERKLERSWKKESSPGIP